jgi:hypothetical protein
VVPLFLKQRPTGTITVTEPRMTRFWITLEQGVRFVIQSVERMQGGEVFVPKLPSTSILDLVEALAPAVRQSQEQLGCLRIDDCSLFVCPSLEFRARRKRESVKERSARKMGCLYSVSGGDGGAELSDIAADIVAIECQNSVAQDYLSANLMAQGVQRLAQ